MKNLNKVIILLTILFILFVDMQTALATEKDVCAVYFTGIGCPHCAKADPFVLGDLLNKYPNLLIIEYEIYQSQENAPLIYEYNNKYNSGLGIPLIIFENSHIAGDSPILKNTEETINKGSSKCPLLKKQINFNELDINSLQGKPKIWTKNRVLIKKDNKYIFQWNGEFNDITKFSKENINKEDLLQLILTDNLHETLKSIEYKGIEPEPVALSGQYINFENAIELTIEQESINQETKLTFIKLISLAFVDAVNPCALAVLTLMLIAILTYNPKKKKNVLLAGFAFVCSVFIMYLIYGLIIIKFFQIVQSLTSIKLLLYKILGGVAILLGVLNIKDFISYKPGSIGTEMPLFMRPKVKKIISGITSPKGAFIVGLFVTIFLLPCTIGPYVIAGGILSAYETIKIIPPLLLYNIIFVLPMIAITLIVYTGISKVEDVSGWKDKNIKYLHLIAGIIMFLLGLAMILGWV